MKKLIIYLAAATFVGAILFTVRSAQPQPVTPDHQVIIDVATGKVKKFVINGQTKNVPADGQDNPKPNPHPKIDIQNDVQVIVFFKGNCFMFNGKYYC